MNILKKIIYIFHRQRYLKYWKHSTLNDKLIFLESQHGNNLNGNIFYIIKELSKSNFDDYEIYLSYNKKKIDDFLVLLDKYQLNNIHLVELGTKKYYKKLSEAKFLFNDTSFLTFFIKKPEQVYVNTWHGTPLKNLGRYVNNDCFNIGNIQKNFLNANYIISPNKHTQEKIIDSFMISNLYEGSFLKCGYPRNTVFFDSKRRQSLRDELNLSNKQIIAYMPTWRGKVGNVNDEVEFIYDFLDKMDKELNDNQIMFVNLHPFMKSHIYFNRFQHLKEFPKEYETYDFLNATDCLITDYSSVLFDYANTGRKIILFVPDLEEYTKERGLSIDLNDLPFPKVYDVESLLLEVNDDSISVYDKFLKKYCEYDSKYSVSSLLKDILCNESNIDVSLCNTNGKKNVLIFAGRMVNNGITTSLLNLLNIIDDDKYNIFVSLTAHNNQEGLESVNKLPKYVNYYPHSGKMILTISQLFYLGLYYFRLVPRYRSDNILNHIFKYEYSRLYHGMNFDSVIHFRGYVFSTMWLINQFTCKKSIYVHNDMIQEMKSKRNQHPWTLKYMYNHFDNVAVVSEDIKYSTFLISHRLDNIRVCKNVIDYDLISFKGNQNLIFDNNTDANIDKTLLFEKLKDDVFTFVNVGRFSVEKGHMRLLEAFEIVHNEYPNTQLLIIGGYGKLYSSLLKEVSKRNLCDCVFVIKNLSNPLPFVKLCDGFVLSSFYEGFGLVLAEANILGLPIFTTDIVGPKAFMNKYGGHIYSNSIHGIYTGMIDMYNHRIKVINIDYKQYNEEAVEEFYSLIDD